MSTFDIPRGIQSDELEIGYGVIDVNHSPDIVSRTLVRDELKLLLSVDDELAGNERVDVHSLEGKTAAMYRKGTSFSESLLLRVLTENNVRVNLRYVTEQATVFNLAAMGLAFAVVLDESELIRRNPLL